MRARALFLPVILSLSACGEQDEFPVCNTFLHAEEASAISQELTKREIAHRVEGNMVCHRNDDANSASEARAAVDEYYRAVATILPDEEAQKRITKVLDQDKKPYSIENTAKWPRLLILHSLSPDEVMDNRLYLLRVETMK